MSGISTAIEVQDRVSGSLNRITAALYNTTSAFHDVDMASETAFNTSGVQAMAQEMYSYEARIQELESSLVDANNRLEQMEQETKEVKQQAAQLESAFSKVGGIIAGLGIGMLVKQQVSEAVDYASDLTEVQNVVDVVYGNASESVNEWAKNTLDAFGLNELSAKRYAGTMGAMLQSSGMTGEKVQEMSTSLTELAGDMASFYNLDADEAFNKIRSGISGETEPLKQLGINMSVANLEAYALSQGIEKSYSEMSQAEQTMIRYNYLMRTTANAQGDFGRTSKSFANQTKLLKENWTAFTGELATNALPILASGIELLNRGITFISDNWSIIQPILLGILTMVGLYTAALVTYNAVKTISAIVEGVHAAAMALSEGATFAATAAQYGFNAALFACPIVWIIAAVLALVVALYMLVAWINKTQGTSISATGIIAGYFATLASYVVNRLIMIYNYVASLAEFLINVFNNPVYSIKKLFANLAIMILDFCISATSSFDDVATNLANAFIEGANAAISAVNWVIDALNDFLDTDISNVGELDQVVSITSTMETAKADIEEWVGEAPDDYIEIEKKDYVNMGEWAMAGYNWGVGVEDKISGLGDINSLMTDTIAEGLSPLDDVANNTGTMADSVDISNENLKYLKDLAEQEAVNRFTTAEIKVDMTNNNNIASGTDVDGIINTLSEGLLEAMATTAEGVHV